MSTRFPTPDRWWFQNDDYWTTLLDLMAHSRLNWLDIHGAWDISVTNAPNLYAYFVSSPSFPKVGVPDEVKRANLARLNKVVTMAHARGIRVSLMAYEANLKIPQNPNPPYSATEANVYTYTKEVVEKMVTGRMEKYYEEFCLLEQPFVKDTNLTVGALLTEKLAKLGENMRVRRFTRFALGEGIDKQ